jgi:hypothetical protein
MSLSSLVAPVTFELRIRAIRSKRRSSRFASTVKLGAWLTGLVAAVTVAGGVLIGSR